MLNIIIYKSISILFLTYKIEILFLLSVEDISKHQSIKASKHQISTMADSAKIANYKNKGKTADTCRESRKDQMNKDRNKARQSMMDAKRVKTTQTDYSEIIEMHSVLFNGKKYIDSFKYKLSLESHMGHGCDNCMTYSAIEDILIGLCTNCAYALAEANNQSHGLYKCDLYEDDNLIIPPYVTELEKYIVSSYCNDNPFESRELPPLISLDASLPNFADL